MSSCLSCYLTLLCIRQSRKILQLLRLRQINNGVFMKVLAVAIQPAFLRIQKKNAFAQISIMEYVLVAW